MANFCSKCRTKMGEGDKFCPSCGSPAFAKGPRLSSAESPSAGAVGHWEAKEIDTGDGYGQSIKGVLTLSKNEIIFYRNKFFSGSTKEWRRIPIRGIKSIYRAPVFNLISIKYNRKPEKTGLLSRIFNSKAISYKIKGWESFIQNIRPLSPNIKIKV